MSLERHEQVTVGSRDFSSLKRAKNRRHNAVNQNGTAGIYSIILIPQDKFFQKFVEYSLKQTFIY